MFNSGIFHSTLTQELVRKLDFNPYPRLWSISVNKISTNRVKWSQMKFFKEWKISVIMQLIYINNFEYKNNRYHSFHFVITLKYIVTNKKATMQVKGTNRYWREIIRIIFLRAFASRHYIIFADFFSKINRKFIC